jgi:hypothetical protein
MEPEFCERRPRRERHYALLRLVEYRTGLVPQAPGAPPR